MRCTDCNKRIRPVIALDLDGTLGRWHRHFYQFAEGYFGRTFNPNWTGVASLAQHMGISKEQYRACKLAFRQSGLKRTMPMYTGADKLVAGLRRLGAEVWITTTRPYMRLDNIDPDTQEWLSRNDIYYDGLLYDEDKYAKLLEIVGPLRVVGTLEDEAECYDRAEELGLHPVLISRLHNRATPRHVEATSFNMAAHILGRRLQEWRAHHDVEQGDGDGNERNGSGESAPTSVNASHKGWY